MGINTEVDGIQTDFDESKGRGRRSNARKKILKSI